jgi:polyphenol oxidase
MPAHQTQPQSLDIQNSLPPGKVEVIQSAAMSAIPWLLHGFSTRKGGLSTVYGRLEGDLNLGFTETDGRANVVANRDLFLRAVTGDPRFPLVTVRQIHSAIVICVRSADGNDDSRTPQADGMMTIAPGFLLGIQTADCIPVLVADRKRRAVAAFHAGWRGTLQRIVEEGVSRMRLEFGSDPEDLVAAIGPGIGQCCYCVGEEVRDEFSSHFPYAAELFSEVEDREFRKPLLNLVEANRRQLQDAGLTANGIFVTGECTNCRADRHFSYRAERGFTGRMLSVIGIRRG